VVTFEYAALHYQSPEGNQYAFMLEGFDKDWNYVGNQRIATYTNLPPGKYVFKVKAANNDGIWNETPVELAITVRPPWWKTLFFKLLVVFLSVSFIVSFYLLRIRIMKKRQKDLQDMVLSRTVELNDVNVQLEEKQEEISLQNDELMRHRNELEKLIDERTAELKEAKSRAEDADQLKSAFLANMSHEVRTPMNAIIGFAALLEDESVEKEEKEYFIKMIRNNGDTLLTLIDDILDISIIEANQLDLDISEFCLDEIFQELYSYYDLRNDRNIKLELFREDPEDKVYLKTDQIRFRQVMNNLLTNAFKYTEAGYIRFGYRKTGKKIRIFVEDSGVGIEDGDSEKVFDYFHKLNISETKLYQGTGIGLSICKKLVELMESEIRLESQPGKGSMFYFDLPGHGFEDEQEGRFSDKKIREDLRGISILIAEDEPNNYKLVERILSKTGADLHWAQNGLEAVEYVESNFAKKNLLVIMDIKMPIMNGIEAIREIKKIDKSIPVIAVTAYAQASEKTRIMKERFDHYISKPLHANHLKEIVYYFATELTPE
jgi:signal transduction histidine kinase/CheY-like chemotaxis protein